MTKSLNDRLQIFHAIAKLVTAIMARPVRAVDLGCGHCKFMVAAQEHGWDVTGVDARLERVPDGISVIQARVQDFDLQDYNPILCLGIFYHLQLHDQLDLIEKFAEKILIVDTHYGMHETAAIVQGQQYWGSFYQEGNKATSSFGNPQSFWPTEPDLIRMLGKRHNVMKWLPEHHPRRSFYLLTPK